MDEIFVSSLFKVLLNGHIAFGFLGLVSFWLAVVLRNQKSKHRMLGLVFFWSMMGLALTAFILSILTFQFTPIVHPGWNIEDAKVFSLFLSGLGFLSAIGCLNGWTAVNKKEQYFATKMFVANVSLLVFSGVLIGLAIWKQHILLVVSGTLGLNICFPYLRSHFKGLVPDWRETHISYMMGGGIALHTAFVAGGGSRYMPEFVRQLGWFGWLLPALLFQPLIFKLVRKK